MTISTIEKIDLFNIRTQAKVKADVMLGDCLDVLKRVPNDSVNLIVTSPPYADQRKSTYGGISPDEYVDWFLPIADELLRIVHPKGTFILNIKEKVVNSERHTYVMELIIAMRKQGWLWTEEFIWHKKIVFRANGLIVSEIRGSGSCNSIKQKILVCIKMQCGCPWVTGQKLD